MDADHRKRDDRLFPIKDVAGMVPVSERSLRDVVADLGFRRPPGRLRHLLVGLPALLIWQGAEGRRLVNRRAYREPAADG